ncbi:MAG: hypothetical protein QOD30_2077 [Actinomycetota bacterium]|jgi:dolichyl-phosphate-mannose--protein O-mannosyl transferase|nr:hypothetical protein [Actinomycetota bacterium]
MPVHLALVLAAATTSTTVEEDVPRIVGDPLSWWVFIGAGVALFVFIVVGGLLVRRRASRAADLR